MTKLTSPCDSSLPTLRAMPHRPKYFAPLSIAAYLTWLAIATEPALKLWQGGWPPSAWMLLGFAALCAVPALFVWREANRSLQARRRLTLLQIPAALLSFAVFGDGMQPVLLILVAAQAAALFSARQALLWMAAANGVLLALMLARYPLTSALAAALSYIGFQCFAAFTTRAMADAQNARDEAQHINAELLATRALLAEGARAEERLHLSRELHDVAGHKLTALKLQLGLCAAGNTESSAALLASRQLADELLNDVRGVVGALRAHEGVDLHAALTALAESIPVPRIALVLAADARPADFARAQALLRAAQEGVTNALRHAGASTLRIELSRTVDGLQLRVQDNGCGPVGSTPGNGLTGLRERLAAVGGALHLVAAAGGGSCLTATVPA